MLDPDVELRIDGGVLRKEASLALRGARFGTAGTEPGLLGQLRKAVR